MKSVAFAKTFPAVKAWNIAKNAEKKSPKAEEKLCPASACVSAVRKRSTNKIGQSAFTTAGAAKTVSSNKCYLISEKRIILRKILSYENGRKFYHYGCRLTFANLTGLSAYSSATQPGMGCVFVFGLPKLTKENILLFFLEIVVKLHS